MKNEAKIQRRIQSIWKARGGWCFKVHGNEFTGAGIPDLIGLIPVKITTDMVGMELGLFVGLEVKRNDKEEASLIQLHTLLEIAKRKGYAEVVHSVKEGKHALRKARALSTDGSGICNVEKIRSDFHEARDRKNLGKLRSNRKNR